MQEIWGEKLDWDESLPSALYSACLNLSADICLTQKLQFPRLALVPNSVVDTMDSVMPALTHMEDVN